MKNTVELKKQFVKGEYDNLLTDIYLDENKIEYQRERYVKAIEKFEALYGEADVEIYSAPGRSEVSGNHTDHQHGEVLAASINLDAIAIVKKNDVVRVVSDNAIILSVSFPDKRITDIGHFTIPAFTSSNPSTTNSGSTGAFAIANS